MDFDFGENASVLSLDKVPEQFRPLYTMDTAAGVFKLAADDPKVKGAVEAIVGAFKALKAERKVSSDLKTRAVDLTVLADYGKAPEEIAAGVRAKLDELQSQIAAGKGAKLDLDKIKQDLAAAHAKETDAKVKQIGGLQAQLESILVDNALRSSIGDQSVDADLLLPFAKNFVKTINEDGRFNAVVVDADGSRRYSGATGQPMTVTELIADMKRNPKYAPLFKSESPKGSGSLPGAAGGRQRATEGKVSSLEKIKAGLEKAGL